MSRSHRLSLIAPVVLSFWLLPPLPHRTPATSGGQSVTGRDSAGIRIVEVSAGVLAALPIWRLEGPTTRIDASMGGVEYELNRAGSPWQLSDGRIVVINDAVELRYFDAGGKYLTTVARRGRGPGEYEQLLRTFRMPGDTLLAWDVPTRRIDVRDPKGKFIRAFNLPSTLLFAGIGGKGAVVVPFRLPPRKLGLQQDTLVLHHLREDGTAGDVVAYLPGSWTHGVDRGDRGFVWQDVRPVNQPMLAGGSFGAVFAQGDEFTVTWFGDHGKVAVITRVRTPRVRLTAEDRRGEEQRLSDIRSRNPRVRVDPGQPMPVYATYVPQITRLVVDNEGRAWLRQWARYGTQGAEWIILERFGAPMARVTMPGAFMPNDIGADYVLGMVTDGDGVQSIHRYALIRSGDR